MIRHLGDFLKRRDTLEQVECTRHRSELVCLQSDQSTPALSLLDAMVNNARLFTAESVRGARKVTIKSIH